MKILLVGSGGREHALAWKLTRSPLLTKLMVAPGSDAIGQLPKTQLVAISAIDLLELTELAVKENIDLVVVGPEDPLAAGLADQLGARNIPCFGPSKEAAKLEASKNFTKLICQANGIPTARAQSFTEVEPAQKFLESLPPPYVIKADGLAAGKGVVIAQNRAQADLAVKEMLGGQFGSASNQILIEEFLRGPEASLFALVDGETVLPLCAAQDHKRAFEGDRGPNTGGMGAYSPAPIVTDKIFDAVVETIIRPTAIALAKAGTPYRGVLYAGLMLTDEGPKLIEYNCRFGDPECQVIMPRLAGDLLPLLLATAKGELANQIAPDWHEDAAICVVMATQGYPGEYKKGSRIAGVSAVETEGKSMVFHAGTAAIDDSQADDINIWTAQGGRVLNIVALHSDFAQARDQAYQLIEKIDWPEGFYRRDIGYQAL